MAGLQVNVLGAFEARDGGGQPLVVSARKSRALIAALALAPQSAMARESLAGLLWSDRGADLRRLRPGFNAAALEVLPFARNRDLEHLAGGLNLAGAF